MTHSKWRYHLSSSSLCPPSPCSPNASFVSACGPHRVASSSKFFHLTQLLSREQGGFIVALSLLNDRICIGSQLCPPGEDPSSKQWKKRLPQIERERFEGRTTVHRVEIKWGAGGHVHCELSASDYSLHRCERLIVRHTRFAESQTQYADSAQRRHQIHPSFSSTIALLASTCLLSAVSRQACTEHLYRKSMVNVLLSQVTSTSSGEPDLSRAQRLVHSGRCSHSKYQSNRIAPARSLVHPHSQSSRAPDEPSYLPPLSCLFQPCAQHEQR